VASSLASPSPLIGGLGVRRDNMTPSVLNNICARPVVISWIIGACVLDGLLLTVPSNGLQLISIASDWQGAAFLLLAVVAATGLGFFLGMFTCWPWIRHICSRINGAPLRIGDRVLVLSRRHRGTTTQVYEITTGQGGWDLARLDLGTAHRDKFTDIFEEYSVLKVNGEPGSAANGSQPIRSETNSTSSAAGSRR
jgi:hypothetical protein